MQLFPAIYTKTPTRMSGLRGYVTASFGSPNKPVTYPSKTKYHFVIFDVIPMGV